MIFTKMAAGSRGKATLILAYSSTRRRKAGGGEQRRRNGEFELLGGGEIDAVPETASYGTNSMSELLSGQCSLAGSAGE